jgi:tetratricopeptide (TPR) repeat protein
LELDPSWTLGHWWLGRNYELGGLFSEAIPHYEKAMELADTPHGLGDLGHAYAKSGRVDEAQAVLERLEELAKFRYVAPLERANVYAGLGDLDRSFEWLEKAYDERSGYLPFVAIFPLGKDIGHDPRFSDLMRRIGLEE